MNPDVTITLSHDDTVSMVLDLEAVNYKDKVARDQNIDLGLRADYLSRSIARRDRTIKAVWSAIKSAQNQAPKTEQSAIATRHSEIPPCN